MWWAQRGGDLRRAIKIQEQHADIGKEVREEIKAMKG